MSLKEIGKYLATSEKLEGVAGTLMAIGGLYSGNQLFATLGASACLDTVLRVSYDYPKNYVGSGLINETKKILGMKVR